MRSNKFIELVQFFCISVFHLNITKLSKHIDKSIKYNEKKIALQSLLKLICYKDCFQPFICIHKGALTQYVYNYHKFNISAGNQSQ